MSQVQIFEEAKPASPRNLTIELPRDDDAVVSDKDKDSNCNEERTDIKMSSLPAITTNRTPSSPINTISCEIEHGPNSTTKKEIV